MSGIMLLLVSLSFCLWPTDGAARSGKVILRDALERGPVSLNDMFRELEELMQDTRQILEETVDQITTESAKSSLTSLDLRTKYNNGTKKMKDEDKAAQVLDKAEKETNNKTGDIHLSHTHMEISGFSNIVEHVSFTGGMVGYKLSFGLLSLYETKFREVAIRYYSLHRRQKTETKAEIHRAQTCHNYRSMSTAQECMVDEDCGDLKYCLYEIENSRCLPCIPTDMPCTKDEECCSDQMCVWGQCTVNATKGTEGTICQDQSDCRPDLCCAFQRELLFPVCNPKPEKGESCLSHPNLLMDMLAWNQEGPRDHCPCADNLHCQPHGRGSVCGE